MWNLTLRQLRTLQALAEHRSLVATADLLGLTPPAVSAQIKALEDKIQVQVIERTQEGFAPTDAGYALIRAHQRINAVLEECQQSVRAIAQGQAGRVKLGVVSTAKYFAPSLVAGFLKHHPSCELTLEVGNKAVIGRALLDYRIDVAIMGSEPDSEALERVNFAPHPLLLVASKDHPLAALERVDLGRLARETLLLREEGSGSRRAFERHLGTDPSEVFARTMTFGGNETIKQAVMAGLGVACLSAHTIGSELADGRLRVLALEGMPIMRVWAVKWLANRQISPVLRAFIDYCQAHGREYLPDPLGLMEAASPR